MSAAARLLRRLRRPFSGAAAASDEAPPQRTLKELFDDVNSERDLPELVRKFKSSSDVYRFRCNLGVYRSAVRRLAAAGDLPSVHDILSAQKQYRDIHKEGFAARLISLYGKAGMFGHARDLFDELPLLGCPRSTMTFNTLLSAAVESGNSDKVPDFFFGRLPGELSIKPDIVSYRLLIRAYCEMERLDEALSALEKMKDDDIVPIIAIFDTILTALYENQRFDDADKVWERMEECGVEPDVGSFNAKMRGLVLSGKVEEAAEVFDGLSQRGLRPDIHSFNALIKGWCEKKNVEEVTRLYGEMGKRSISPNYLTFSKMVPVLCEAGDFVLAYKVSKRSIASRCYIHEDVLQRVVDGLVENSMVVEAKELVKLCRGHYDKDLVLPVE